MVGTLIEKRKEQHPEEEVLFGILACRRRRDEIGEKLWLAKLRTEALRWSVLKLLDGEQTTAALEVLADFPGFFYPHLRLGVLDRYHSLKCTKV